MNVEWVKDIEWQWLGTLLAFLIGLLAPSIKTVFDEVLLVEMRSKRENKAIAVTRADKAAEVCFEELTKLLDVVPRWAAIRSSAIASPEDEVSQEQVRVEHDSALGRLEANVVLLQPGNREAMGQLLETLRYAHDLPIRHMHGHEFGWHPDSVVTITRACVHHGRAVLASHLRREPLPTVPPEIQEYQLAVDERNDDLMADFAQEVHEDEEAIRHWREHRGLTPDRQR